MGLGLQSESQIATVEPQNDSKAILITGNSVGNTSIYLRDLKYLTIMQRLKLFPTTFLESS